MTREHIPRRTVLRSGAVAAGLLGVGTGVGSAQSADHCYYQIDFVAGEPIETLGATPDAFYGRQNRLIQYLHGDDGEVTDRDTWVNSLDSDVRRDVTAEPIQVFDQRASVGFRVAEGRERTLSLAAYSLPGGEFSFGTQQELLAAATGTFGPGTHRLWLGPLSPAGCPRFWETYERGPKFTLEDGSTFAQFGLSVAIADSGDTVVVGAPHAGYGSAYVFTRAGETWTRQAKLDDDATPSHFFGQSVAVSDSGDTALVGAPGDETLGETGEASVFGRTAGTWTRQATLVAEDAAPGDNFGASVAVADSGNVAVVGAIGDDSGGGNYSGAVYVFGRTDDTWTQRAKLAVDDAVEDEAFGISVDISGSGDTVLVGARGNVGITDYEIDSGEYTYPGAAYVFARTENGWTQQTGLVHDDAVAGDGFGQSVAVSGSGDTALIGASNTEAVYVFSRANGVWTQEAIITADDAEDSGFGSAAGSVAISAAGDTAVIGAFGDSEFYADAGSMYVFARTNSTWTRQVQFTALDPAPKDYFGGSVTVSGSGDTVVVGASRDDDAGEDSGSAYVFEK